MSDDASAARPPNRLIREKSPYLLQHAHNPVDWYPWGEEAFARARVERKPILLSIGYSTCHWCHVMERESFEDVAIAERLRRSFVAIKVDREERPDIDRLYMTAAQAMGLGGGWPLNLFLTPEAEPFYGGTYFPPEPRHGRPSFRQILESVERAWAEQPARIEESGRRVLEALAGLDRVAGSGSAAPRSEELFEEAYRHFEQTFDSRDGGFGSAPKFPTAVNLEFLLRVGSREPARAETALEMVARQLDAMRAGGIHDHLGGGFHRYSTDARWLVPHFEKMLYDQAQLASICLDAFQVTGRAEYAETSRGIFGYVMRDLSAGRPAGDGLGASGAFCSAEDADSEGEEGRFYVWTPGEVAAVLGGDEATLFDFVYGVSPAGNFERGAAILSLVRTNAEAARRFGLGEEEVARRLEADRARLLEARGRRVRPSRDDKVIASWNGLMISALARGARVLDDPSLAARAAEAAEFVWTALRADVGDADAPLALARRWRDGEAAGAGQLADYAACALGCLDLYEAAFDPLWLERASRLTDALVRRFFDAEHGGFFESPAGADSLRVRLKDGFDGAEIAGNSLAAEAAQRLGSLLDRREWLEAAGRTFGYYGARLAGGAYAMPRMLAAMDLATGPPRHVVVAGRPEAEDTRALVREFRRRYLPRDLLLLSDGGERSRRLATLAPFAATLAPAGGRATAYVCVDYACRLPVTDVNEFAAQLDEMEKTRPEER